MFRIVLCNYIWELIAVRVLCNYIKYIILLNIPFSSEIRPVSYGLVLYCCE